MLNYHKNKLINEFLSEYYATFQCTLDTQDYVPPEFNERILNMIFREMKKDFKRLKRENRRYQRQLRCSEPECSEPELSPVEPGPGMPAVV